MIAPAANDGDSLGGDFRLMRLTRQLPRVIREPHTPSALGRYVFRVRR